ncbi:MAG: zf-HC2 domain-containing protein [Cytophagaceae bacterium]|nr:zf-HC2 domain-containing protein [Cytophagaceae bacterium]MDW8455326.1 hypothetical protein [Cytophagaceae bacterium]
MIKTITHLIHRLIGKKEHSYCCKNCINDLYLVLDGEAEQKQEEELLKHIEKCEPCFTRYQIEKSVKEVIKYKIQHKQVPPQLIHSIKEKINGII